MTRHPETPWNLTPGEQKALDALTATGTFKEAARSIDSNYHTLHELVRRARAKMGTSNFMLAVVMWDRFRRDA